MLYGALAYLAVLLAWSHIAVALITLGIAFLAFGASVSVGTTLIVIGGAMLLLAMRSEAREAVADWRWRRRLKAAGFD